MVLLPRTRRQLALGAGSANAVDKPQEQNLKTNFKVNLVVLDIVSD